VLVALALMFTQLRLKKAPPQKTVDWTKFIFILIGLLFYITLFNILGYFTATFIFLFYFFKIADTPGWLFPCMMAVGSSTVFYLLFKDYLAVALP